MGWAVTMEGRSDPGGIVLLLEDRAEAESIAKEICTRGTPVTVRLYTGSNARSGANARPGANGRPER